MPRSGGIQIAMEASCLLCVPVLRVPVGQPFEPGGVALVIMLGAQLMIILDATVVNIAPPHIMTSLNFPRRACPG